MKVLVINAGSSSLKYQLIDMTNEHVLAKGNCERIGIGGGLITHKTKDDKKFVYEVEFPTHTEAFLKLTEVLTSGETKVIEDMSEISAVGHRVVQGAEVFSESVLVTDDVVDKIEDLAELAPLHNKAHALAIRACQKVLNKSVPQVVVFDTAFHSTMPDYAYIFGVPYEYYTKYHVRRYGFHGTSHKFVSARCAELMGRNIEDLKIVTCHLGNGSSITAVKGGKSIDTSMGFTPLGGIIMGTRSGSLDPSVVTYIAEKENMNGRELCQFLNKNCGYIGVSGKSSDNRDLVDLAAEGDYRAKLTLDIQRYQIKKYIGAYACAMGGIDALVFTGGIGENNDDLRSDICSNLGFLGIKIDEEINTKFNRKEKDITAEGATVRTFIIPTNEELAIARDTMRIASKL